MFQIFPKNEHFKITMYANALLGVWPFIFEENKTLKKLYEYYSKFTMTYFFLFIISTFIKLFQILTAEEILIQELFSNLSITLIYAVTIVRVRTLKTKRLQDLVKGIMDTENKIYDSGERAIIEIYNAYASRSKLSNIIFVLSVLSGE